MLRELYTTIYIYKLTVRSVQHSFWQSSYQIKSLYQGGVFLLRVGRTGASICSVYRTMSLSVLLESWTSPEVLTSSSFLLLLDMLLSSTSLSLEILMSDLVVGVGCSSYFSASHSR